MYSGVIKFFNRKQGFGFITEKGTGQDYFITFRSFSSPAPKFKYIEGAEVEFEPFGTKAEGKDPAATNVRVIKYAQ